MHVFIYFAYVFTYLLLVCGLLNVGVAAIFGPQSTHTASHVQSICDNMEVIFANDLNSFFNKFNILFFRFLI